MNDSLFIAKRKDNGQLVVGYHAIVDPVDKPDSIRKPMHVIFPIKSKKEPIIRCNWFNKYFYGAIEVIPNTVKPFNKNNKLPEYHLVGE